MWEESEWEIHFDCEVNADYKERCKHCGPIYDKIHDWNTWEGIPYITKNFKCARVVVAINEGGYNTTGVCLDCILEAAEKNKA